MKRVAITGLGTVAPTGNDVKTAWDAALHARSGTGRISLFDASSLKVQIAAEVKGFDASAIVDAKDLRRLERFILFATGAAHEAIQDAGLSKTDLGELAGCSIGVGMGSIAAIEDATKLMAEKGERRLSPFFIPYTIPNMAAGFVSLQFNLKGPNMCPATACASGTHAIGEAYQYIKEGRADIMVCGGAESTISPLGIAAFTACKALSANNNEAETASRPFDATRDGFVMGEGSGILVLEDMDRARKRGARIYGELIGYGLSADAFHITAPPEKGEGGQRAMRMALDSAKLNPEDVDYINAHGTSTSLNDQYESEAIQAVFGDAAKHLHVSSTKGVTGHCIGAAGGIEAVYATLAIYHNVVPPTANLKTPDPKCTLNYAPNQAVEKQVQVALSNSFGFGGTNATIAIKSFH